MGNVNRSSPLIIRNFLHEEKMEVLKFSFKLRIGALNGNQIVRYIMVLHMRALIQSNLI